MTDKDKKGNGEPTPSRIVIEFTGPGIADQIQVKAEGVVTQGQFQCAALQLVGMALFDIFGGMTAQMQKRAQEQAMMQSIIKNAKGQ